MLSRAGLCRDARLVHAYRQQRLSKGVVHLVRAGVAEVLALQINFRAAKPRRQILAQVKRRRASHEFPRALLELVAEFWIAACLLVGALELEQRRHQGFRNVLSAELAEMAAAIGNVLHFLRSSSVYRGPLRRATIRRRLRNRPRKVRVPPPRQRCRGSIRRRQTRGSSRAGEADPAQYGFQSRRGVSRRRRRTARSPRGAASRSTFDPASAGL